MRAPGRLVARLSLAIQDLVRAILPSHHSPATTTTTTANQPHPRDERGFVSRLYGYPPPKAARETAWLDGVRGVAATLVMVYHVNIDWYGITLEAPYGSLENLGGIWRLPILRNFMCSGHAQVSLFFVLSGMVLSWGPLASIRQGRSEKFVNSLSSSAFRRWIRLFLPCFLVALSPMVQVCLGVLEIPTVERKSNPFAQLWDFVKACERFANPFAVDRSAWDAMHAYAWMFWTIPFEWAGSLCVFLVLLAVSRINDYAKRALVVGFIAAYACASGRWIYWLFTSGILVADYVQQAGGFEQLNSASRLRTAFWIALFFAGLFFSGHPERSDIWSFEGTPWGPFAAVIPTSYMDHDKGIRFWWSWGGLFILISACHIKTMRRFFEMNFIRYLGQISYMLYLTHGMVEHWLGNSLRGRLYGIFGHATGDDGTGPAVIENPLAFLLVYVFLWSIEAPCIFLVAHWAEVLFDMPSIRFAKWVDEKFVHGFLPEDKPEEEIPLTA